MQKLYVCLFVLITAYTNTSFAQPTYPAPSGVYCSCGPTTGVGNGSVDPAVAAKSFVKGILVRVGWDKAEPTDNNYNWALIDGQIAAAKTYGKKISLGVGCGIATPQWVFTAGAQYLVSTAPYTDTIPLPWDNTFLTKWTDFITQLGNRYKDDTTITLVYITNSSANGYEMQLPYATTPTLAAAGYTDAKMIQSWKTVVDAFSAVFPNHYLSNDFHPVNNSNTVADSVYAYARTKAGSRYGANAWWWTQKNTTVYPSQYNILKHSASNNTFTGVQFAYSGTTDSAQFGAGGMPAALQLAVNDNVCYWELWNQDILNNKYDSLLKNVACGKPTNSITTTTAWQPSIYPNPATHTLHIATGYAGTTNVQLYNTTGQCIRSIRTKDDSIALPIADIPAGIYSIHIYTPDGNYMQTVSIVH